MASILNSIIEYTKGCLANITKADSTADGNTDGDKQEDQVNAATTDGKDIANSAFSGPNALAAERMVGTDMYDIGQSNSRINSLYNCNREGFYNISKQASEARKNRLGYKTTIATNTLKTVDEIKEITTYD